MAHDVIDLCEHIGWTNNVHLIGVSMGGMISQELMLAKPQYFRSLCLTSTTPGMTLPPASVFFFLLENLIYAKKLVLT